MGSDVGQIFQTASLHRDHSILYTLICEKEISHMGKNNGNPVLVRENFFIFTQQKVQKRPLSTAGWLCVGWVEVFMLSLVK